MQFKKFLVMLVLMGSVQIFSMLTEAETERLIEDYQKQHPYAESGRSAHMTEKRMVEVDGARKLDTLDKLIEQYKAQGNYRMVEALKEKREVYHRQYKMIKNSRIMPS